MNLCFPGEYIFILVVLIVGPLHFSISAFGTDRNQLAIPTVEQNIPLDGNVDEKSWSNSYHLTFPEAGAKGQNVTIYLHYEPNEMALVGAFVIPDDSPADNVGEFDAIRFIFDVDPRLSSVNTQSVIHDLAIYRYGEIIYRIGNEIKSKSNVSPLNLQPPLERIEFKTNSDANRWTGQFRIYLSTEPTIYKFTIQQQNDWTGKQGNISMYPSPSVNLVDTSTWGNILFRTGMSGNNIAPTPTPEVISPPTPETTTPPTSPPSLTVFSKKVDGLTVTIDGQKSSEITRILCNWGDGTQSNCSFDPHFDHTYTKSDTYEITVYGFDKHDKQVIETDPISVSVKATDDEVTADDQNPLVEPVVLAAIVTTIGGIVGALIALKKRGGSS